MHTAIMKAKDKIEQNAQQGRRTLLLCYFAGHGATYENSTNVLINTNQRGEEVHQYDLEGWLSLTCAKVKGSYVI